MRSLVRGLEGPAAPPGSGRDLRVDLFRGLALFCIFIDHVPGNWLGLLTLRNIALCDATEAFVLLAGYAAGLAYGAELDRRGYSFAAASLVRRIGTLYVAHIFLFVVFTAQVGFSAAALDTTAYLDELHLDVFAEQPYLALLQALLLRFQPAFLDILPLYIVLLLLLVPMLPLLRAPPLLLGLSAGLYLAVRLADVNLPSWTGGGWFFNPLAWQFLFFFGCALGYVPRRPDGRRGRRLTLPFHPALASGAALILLLGGLASLISQAEAEAMALLPEHVAEVLSAVDKTGLHPLRLLSILALTYLVAHLVPVGAAWVRSAPLLPFVLMGQHGLPVFCTGIFLSFLGRLALELSDRWPMQLGVNLAGILVLTAVGVIGAWYRLRGSGGRPVPAPESVALPTRAASLTNSGP
ncbi:OpgC domain-containing protein [Siccirubricoccus sp. KC 17139]|uniref:OpgC domain-containing protein n=1 Tax=Siccirubricoccus soli TaxID=2899147 RepID=A0ABT1D3X7_9PROT|nr:OpgC domain-containing protein [Siccirubricoccus soli]MCO6416622.1 OpgC domain-containing protein [Siccirubricoccus soli]MCP2682757.1 OpgC domain-containing protein [Siccirubricoccus soli]